MGASKTKTVAVTLPEPLVDDLDRIANAAATSPDPN
jgi:hypothetical protein